MAVSLVVLVQFAVAALVGWQPSHALEIVGAIVVVTAALVFPRFVLVVALLATFFPQRVGPAALDLSVTDAVATLGALTAIRFIPWRDRRFRLMIGALAIYMFTLGISVVAHPGSRAALEWAHRGMLFGGAMFIGIAIVHTGATRIALRGFGLAAGFAAALSVVDSVTHGFEPANALGINKNHMGILLAAAFLVLLTVKDRLAWPNWLNLGLRVLVLVGLAATQSRASAIGLVAAVALRGVLQAGQGRRRQASALLLVLCAGVIGLTYASVNARDLSRSDNEQKFNAINTRLEVVDVTLDVVWRPSPVVGGGLRFWSDPDRLLSAPHDVIIGELGEAGVVGLAGLVTLCWATVVALRRGRSDLATMSLMVLVLRLTQGTADVFWVAGPLTVSLILAGMGLTTEPTDDSFEPEPAPSLATARA